MAGTTLEEMQGLLHTLQKMQYKDEFVHNFMVKMRTYDDGELAIIARFESILDKDEDGFCQNYAVALNQSSTYRYNVAEMMKFKLLLESDK